jgi:hypothetical protein
LKSLGREAEAKAEGKRALAIRERTLGHDHPATVRARRDWVAEYPL